MPGQRGECAGLSCAPEALQEHKSAFHGVDPHFACRGVVHCMMPSLFRPLATAEERLEAGSGRCKAIWFACDLVIPPSPGVLRHLVADPTLFAGCKRRRPNAS